jgi:hypothetical protein
MISQPAHDTVSGEEYEGTNDDQTLPEVINRNKACKAKEGTSSPSNDLLSSHLKKPRAATRKHRADAPPSGSYDTPRYDPSLELRILSLKVIHRVLLTSSSLLKIQ